jgi:hypothetical protein
MFSWNNETYVALSSYYVEHGIFKVKHITSRSVDLT